LRVKRRIARTIPAHHQSVAIVLDFVNPERAGRRLHRLQRQARFNEAGGTLHDHGRRIGQRATGSTAPITVRRGVWASSSVMGLGPAAMIEHAVELDRGTRLVGAALVMPKIAEAFPAGSIIRDAAPHNPMGASWF